MEYHQIENTIALLAENPSPSLFVSPSMRTEFEAWGGMSADLFCYLVSPTCLQKTLAKKLVFQPISVFQLREMELEELTNQTIYYSIESTIVGNLLLASYQNSICYASFIGESENSIVQLTNTFPDSHLSEVTTPLHQYIANNLLDIAPISTEISILLVGTYFQRAVWKALLLIPRGSLISYNDLAQQIGKPTTAARAVGSAVGSNQIAYLIPCHRVIRTDGRIGEYRWERTRKQALIALELHQSRQGH